MCDGSVQCNDIDAFSHLIPHNPYPPFKFNIKPPICSVTLSTIVNVVVIALICRESNSCEVYRVLLTRRSLVMELLIS